MELVINPSNIISTLCYSVLRYEPYTACDYNCTYCYAKWYRFSQVVKPRISAFVLFKRLVRRINKLGLSPIPIRISTLSDPLQPLEAVYRLTNEALKLAYQYDYPVILSTKSNLIIKSPWIDSIMKLAEKIS